MVADRPATVRARTESARCVTGFTFVHASSQPGIVDVFGTRTLLPNVSGITQMNARPCTVSGDGATSPTSTEIQHTAR